MTRRRRIATVLAALAVAGLVSSCGDDEDPALRRVTLVLDWTPNTNHAGVYLARAQGRYAAAGIDLDIIEPDPSGGLVQLAAGNGDFAFSYAEALLPARAEGADVVSVATVLRTNTSSLIAPSDRRITRPRDLEGTTYGTYGGAIERPLIEALVRCDGGDPAKVRFVEIGNADYAAGFARGLYDVVWAFDGWDVIRLREVANLDVSTLPLRDFPSCLPDWYTPIIATTPALAKTDPGLIRTFLRVTGEGYRGAAADPAAAAAALTGAVPESDAALVESSSRFLARFYLDRDGRWGHQDPRVWDRFGAFLARSGIVAHDVRTADAYTNAYLEASP